MPAALNATTSDEAGLSALETEAIELFIGFFKLIGLPKSVGEIYGLLFVSHDPLAMDRIMAKLGLSLGAASQGLKVLRSVGAVKQVYVPGARKDHYAADLELSRFATGFIKDELQPRITQSKERIARMGELSMELAPDEKASAEVRLERLKHWLDRADKVLPWVLRFLVR